MLPRRICLFTGKDTYAEDVELGCQAVLLLRRVYVVVEDTLGILRVHMSDAFLRYWSQRVSPMADIACQASE